ncbi:hypothetical protein, partial [Nocardioides sp. BYT-33-1]|uniref:hypothetical protein n=1 Tax=Nocardioides sp. BYT-33-1 TaxID=3416952 RepID=UPI003F53CA40
MTSSGALDTATAVVEHARDLAAGDWNSLSGPDAVAGVEAITTARALLDAALLRGIARLDATDVVRELGWASTK